MSQTPLTKKALADSLKELLRAAPFDKISVSDICENAGTSRRNFYRHFPDKYALLVWIYDEGFCSINPHYDEWVLQDYFFGICNFLYRDRKFYSRAFLVTGQNSFREFCREKLYPLFVKDFAGVFVDKQVERFFIVRMSEAIFDALQLWLCSEPCMPPDEFAAYFCGSMSMIAEKIAANWKICQEHRR